MKIFNIISLLVVLFIGQHAIAQKSAKIFVSDGVENVEGASIKWVTTSIYSEKGFDLFRNVNSGSWQKVNSAPITIDKSIDTNAFSETADKGLYRALTSMDYQKFQDNKLLKVFVVLQGIHSNQFATAIGMMVNDPTVLEGQTVQYKLMEGEIEIGVSEPYKMGSFSSVTVPDSVMVERNKKGVNINWKPEELSHSGLWIYRKSEGNFEKINDMPARPRKLKNGKWAKTFYQDIKIEKGSNYEYQLVARDYFGRVSKPSKSFAAPALKYTDSPGAIITNLSTKANEMKVVVEWQCEKSKDLKGFNIYEVTEKDTVLKTQETLPVEANSYEYVTDKIGWKVSIVEAVFNATSKRSNAARIFLGDVIPPEIPTSFSVKSDTGRFSFNFNKSNAADLKGYKIYRSIADDNNDDNSWIAITGDLFDSTNYTFKLQDNVTQPFAFYVLAMDTNFNYSRPSKVVVAGLPDIYPPQKPLIKAIDIIKKDSVEQLQIAWLANVDSDLKGYNLYKRPKGDTMAFKKVNFQALPKTSLRYTDRLAKAGIRYEYQLQAEDTNGLESEMSSSFYGGLPERVGDIKPTGIQVRSNSKKKQITVSWDEVPTKNLEGFTIYAGTKKENMRPVSGLSKKNSNTFKVPNAGTYFVQVRAISTRGKVLKSDINETTINQKK